MHLCAQETDTVPGDHVLFISVITVVILHDRKAATSPAGRHLQIVVPARIIVPARVIIPARVTVSARIAVPARVAPAAGHRPPGVIVMKTKAPHAVP